MSIKKINPYIIFDGKAVDAIALYEKALGAKVENVMSYGDMPVAKDQSPPSPENAKRIVHSSLRIGEAQLMVSDGPAGTRQPTESNIHVTVDFDDVSELTKAFDALSAGGTVTMPVHDTFWGAKFAMLHDPFGVCWMLNCEVKKA